MSTDVPRGAARPEIIAGPADWAWTVGSGMVGAAGGIVGATLAQEPPVGTAIAGGVLGLVGAVVLRDRSASAGSGGSSGVKQPRRFSAMRSQS